MNYHTMSYLDREIEGETLEALEDGNASSVGPVARIARHYVPDKKLKLPYRPDRLLGFLLSLSYEDVTIVTCDPWNKELWRCAA